MVADKWVEEKDSADLEHDVLFKWDSHDDNDGDGDGDVLFKWDSVDDDCLFNWGSDHLIFINHQNYNDDADVLISLLIIMNHGGNENLDDDEIFYFFGCAKWFDDKHCGREFIQVLLLSQSESTSQKFDDDDADDFVILM